MYDKILIEDLENKIRETDERIQFYKDSLNNHPEDRMFEAVLKRAEANKEAFLWELNQQKQQQ